MISSFLLLKIQNTDASRLLNAKMKEATQIGVTLKTKGDEKEAVNNEEEKLFWSKGLFGQSSAE